MGWGWGEKCVLKIIFLGDSIGCGIGECFFVYLFGKGLLSVWCECEGGLFVLVRVVFDRSCGLLIGVDME